MVSAPRHSLLPQHFPRIARLIIMSWAVGSAIGLAIAGAIMVFDIGHLGSMIAASEQPWLWTLLLASGFAPMMGGLYAAGAIMLLPRHADDAAWHRLID